MFLREPSVPWQEPYETDEEFGERREQYDRDVEDYEVACDMAVDIQRERDMEDRSDD